MSITVFLADDHALVRDGLRMLLEAQPDLEVIGTAADGRDAVRQVTQLGPDVAILDIAMPELNGLEAARQILETCPATRVIILSMHGASEHVFDALHMGARGYLLKASAGANVADAVRAVHAGRRYLSQEVMEQVIERSIEQHPRQADGASGLLARLTGREREVLQLVVEGKSSAEIARVLHLSPKTVETYRSTLMKKLEINDLPRLVKFAIKHGLTPLE
jgi:DNA-binding NarL/FixJ family response regulator